MLEVGLGNGELWLGEAVMGLGLLLAGMGAGMGAGVGAGASVCLRGLNLYEGVRHN